MSLTISGNPQTDSNTNNLYLYGDYARRYLFSCKFNGTITVNPEAGLLLTPGSDDAQTICENTPILPIDYLLFRW